MSLRASLVTVAFLVSSSGLAAQSLTGTLVDTSGAPVAGASVALSGTAFSAVTDIAGQFTIVGLLNRSYTVQIDPLANPLAPVEFSRTVAGATNLGNYVLQPGAIVSATFTDPLGVPLPQVNCNVYLPDGTKLYTPRDVTNAAGFVSFNVPQTAVTLEALPPIGSTLYPWRSNVTPTGPLALGTIAFQQGYTITGSVARAGAVPLPIANCELIVTDQFTGLDMVLVNKRTNSLGAFSVALPNGLYQFDFVPPAGSPHAARQLFGVPVVSQSVGMGIVGLSQAAAISGTVLGPNGPVLGADIDLYDTLGHKLFTPNDNTTLTGAFSLMVPLGGTYQVRVDPPVVSGLVGFRSAPVSVTALTSIGPIQLAAGIPVVLDLFDSLGAPLEGVVMNVVDPSTQQELVVPGNSTDATGRMTAVVPFGVFDVTLSPRQGSRAAAVPLAGVPFVAPIVAALPLPDRPVSTSLEGLSILGVPNGGEIFVDWAFENRVPAVVPTTVEVVVALASGADVPWIPPLPLDLPPSIGFGLQLWLPTPPLSAAELGFLQKFTIRLRDAATQQVLDSSYVYYQPR
jgi:hypothetical protein